MGNNEPGPVGKNSGKRPRGGKWVQGARAACILHYAATMSVLEGSVWAGLRVVKSTRTSFTKG